MKRKIPVLIGTRVMDTGNESVIRFLLGKAVLAALLEEGILNRLQYEKMVAKWKKIRL